MPDFVSDCRYPMRLNPHCDSVSRASEQWLCSEAHLVEPERTKYTSLRPGYFASSCYPDADAFHLKVCADFLGWSFKLDDWLEIDRFDVNDAWEVRDCCMSAFRDPVNFQTERYSGKMSKSFFGRFKETGGPGCTERFIHAMDLWFISAAKEVDNRAKGHVNDVESYIELRRDLSGCKSCFALIEFVGRIDLPDEVVSHPVIMALEEATNDFVSWSNDIFSYNAEQSHHSTHNLVAVLMLDQGLDLQSAVDYCGRLCNISLQRFEENRAVLPSWGEEVDKEVAIYVEGLQNWITGPLQWTFETTRYFGKDAHTVKRDRTVKLLPKRPL
ncbi:isoprenoid synthase domain-containing protein [Suillus placidus]|uniref:Terpene synthase n=1 Tax=Suillus placidus TaxID=48579 RepID=A0A9P6ZZA7_9AGAM|nr:isoprenoid synthase domain-containing protein [Suillus placidus]